MASELKIPDISDADDCARLLYVSGPRLYTFCFIQKDPEIYSLFKVFFNTSGNIYSKENILVEEKNNKVRGLFLGFPAGDLKKLGKNITKCILDIIEINGFLSFLKMMFRLKLNRYFPELNKDEFFISNLAVYKEYRGKGIGISLLKKAEELAVNKGLSKLSLLVETDNDHAKRIYEKFGFKTEKESFLPENYHKHGLYGFYKMVKNIGS